ncbi:MAG TPA: PilN domain-containing protein [Tepidisphaeraceae bacterium]|nr:PilN domain-containing protein [Tepidisphaeraceae bacterium]
MTAPNELSFLPDDYLEQKYKRRANIVCVILAGVTFAGIGLRGASIRRQNARVESTFAEIDGKYTDAARKIEQVKKMHEQQREVVHHAELAASLVEKVPRSNILAEITNSLPAGVSLLDLSMHATPQGQLISGNTNPYTRGLPPGQSQPQPTDAMGLGTKPLVYDVKMKITGIAQTDVQVANLISTLRHKDLFTDVNLVITEGYTDHQDTSQKDKTDVQLRKWQIEMSLSPNAEVRQDTKTAAVELTK